MRLFLGLLAAGWSQRCWIALTAFAFLAIHAPLAADDEAKSGPSIQIVPPPKSVVFGVTFSKDGRQIALACEDKVGTVHDVATGKLLTRLEGHSERVWTAAFSPDGALLASCSGEYSRPEAGGAVKLWDLKTGKEKASLTGHRGLVFHVTFSPDGKTLLSAGWDGAVKLWDVATSQEKATLTEHTAPVRTIVYSPDGKTFATACWDGFIRFFDAATFKEQKTLKAHDIGVQGLAFSPCGRYLATIPRPKDETAGDEIKLWDLTSGKELGRLTGHRHNILSVDFSRDGKMLVSGGGWFSQYGEVKLFEVASGKERADLTDLQNHKEWVECVKFSPDGLLLVSAGGATAGIPGQVHILRMTQLLEKKPNADPTAEQLQLLWDALADTDAPKAYKAVLTLTASPRVTVPFLKGLIKPIPPLDPGSVGKIPKLIANLDHDSFEERQRAAKELEELGELARLALQKELDGSPSAEVRRQATRILQQMQFPASTPELLRAIRAIEVLEQIATPEAKAVLETLASGTAKDRVASEAKVSLKRMTK
jgi:dipeptidyl aminopeptidase/acylaminoacyl peptidase